jgi:hypothetical protein
MDAESLTAIVELQRAVATGEADVDRAMDLIAVHARNVANATGIAIGLLTGDQLGHHPSMWSILDRRMFSSGPTLSIHREIRTMCPRNLNGGKN